jgi:cytochrome P450
VPHDHHRLRRGAISSFWSKRAVATAQPIITKNLRKLTDILQDHLERDAIVDTHSLLLAFTEDSVMEYALGNTMKLLDNEKKAEAFKDTMDSLADATPVLKQYGGMILIAKKLPLSLVKFVMPRMAGLLEVQLVRMPLQDAQTPSQRGLQCQEAKTVQLSQALGRQAIRNFHSDNASKSGDSSAPSTIFNAILKSEDLSDAEKTPQRLTEEGTVIVGAGGDTVARTCMCFLFFVLSDPKIYSALVQEIDKAMPKWGEIPDLRNLEALPLLVSRAKPTAEFPFHEGC